MADQKEPTPPAEKVDKDKAEGERREQFAGEDREGGITNRDREEEQANQEAVPARGERKGDTHA